MDPTAGYPCTIRTYVDPIHPTHFGDFGGVVVGDLRGADARDVSALPRPAAITTSGWQWRLSDIKNAAVGAVCFADGRCRRLLPSLLHCKVAGMGTASQPEDVGCAQSTPVCGLTEKGQALEEKELLLFKPRKWHIATSDVSVSVAGVPPTFHHPKPHGLSRGKEYLLSACGSRRWGRWRR